MIEKREIIGRREEQGVLSALLQSQKAELLAVYGRRRVGKTFLISNFFDVTNSVFFYVSGIKDHGRTEQISAVMQQLSKVFYKGAPLVAPKRWIDVFELLTKAIDNVPKNKKIVLFFDEFPWMVTKKSKLLAALDYYWNRFWVHDSRLKLIICGSASSWITENIINNKAGLYNRVTRVMEVKPFSLAETKMFLISNGINLNNRQILNLYMVFGGIPFYLAMIEKRLSVEQCINKLCFYSNGALFEEFNRLFEAIVNKPGVYIKIIKLLAKHRHGLSQMEIMKQCNISVGGRAAERLKELEQAGFITSFIPYKHQEKGLYYKIIDEFILFYLQWVEPNKFTIKREGTPKNYWQSHAASPSWVNWTGYAFEAVCYKHVSVIRNALDIGVGAEVGTWRYVPKKGSKESGTQIDLLFDRKDDVITICEIKYSKEPFVIDKQYAAKLLSKAEVYKKRTGTKKQIVIAMISASGLKPTMYSEELIAGCVTLDDLFKE